MPPEDNFRVSIPFLLIAVTTVALVQFGCGCHNSEINSETLHSKDLNPIQLTGANFQQEVIDSDIPVLVDMWAPWCQLCIAMKPTISELAEGFAGQVKVTEVNVDENFFIKEKFEVNRYPTLLVFSRGREVKRMVGVQSKQAIIEALRIVDPGIQSSTDHHAEDVQDS